MSWKEMQVVPIKAGTYRSFGFEFEGSLIAEGNGESILIPEGVTVVTVQVEPTTCSVKVQASIDIVDELKKDNAVWIDWDLGVVSGNSQDTCDPPSAIRLVQIGSGSSKIKVRAQ